MTQYQAISEADMREREKRERNQKSDSVGLFWIIRIENVKIVAWTN